MRLDTFDLTDECYVNYDIDDVIREVTLHFEDTDIFLDLMDFDRLKMDIIKQEGLIKREDSATIEMDGKFSSKREILLKELLKTIDEITDLTNRSDSTYFGLLSDKECPSFKDDLEVRTKLLHMWRERNNKMAHVEKLKAELEYGELQ